MSLVGINVIWVLSLVCLLMSHFDKSNHDKLPTLYWLPKHHKRPYIVLLLILIRVLYHIILNCLYFQPLAT